MLILFLLILSSQWSRNKVKIGGANNQNNSQVLIVANSECKSDSELNLGTNPLQQVGGSGPSWPPLFLLHCFITYTDS